MTYYAQLANVIKTADIDKIKAFIDENPHKALTCIEKHFNSFSENSLTTDKITKEIAFSSTYDIDKFMEISKYLFSISQKEIKKHRYYEIINYYANIYMNIHKVILPVDYISTIDPENQFSLAFFKSAIQITQDEKILSDYAAINYAQTLPELLLTSTLKKTKLRSIYNKINSEGEIDLGEIKTVIIANSDNPTDCLLLKKADIIQGTINEVNIEQFFHHAQRGIFDMRLAFTLKLPEESENNDEEMIDPDFKLPISRVDTICLVGSKSKLFYHVPIINWNSIFSHNLLTSYKRSGNDIYFSYSIPKNRKKLLPSFFMELIQKFLSGIEPNEDLTIQQINEQKALSFDVSLALNYSDSKSILNSLKMYPNLEFLNIDISDTSFNFNEFFKNIYKYLSKDHFKRLMLFFQKGCLEQVDISILEELSEKLLENNGAILNLCFL